MYDGAFLWIHLTAYYFCNKSSIEDARLGYKYLLKHWNFQREAKMEQIIVVVTMHSVFFLTLKLRESKNKEQSGSKENYLFL